MTRLVFGFCYALLVTPFLAAENGSGNEFLQLGIAGACLGVLFWFLKALVNHGVVPFVKGTLEHNARMARAMDTTAEALRTVQHSAVETVGLVRAMSGRLDRHMLSDERTDRAILSEIEACHGKTNPPAKPPESGGKAA